MARFCLFLIITILAATGAGAADQPMHAVLLWDRMIPGVTGTLAFSEYGITDHQYDLRTLDADIRRDTARSRLFYVHTYEALDTLLREDPAMAAVLTTFLEQGGTLLFNRSQLPDGLYPTVRAFLEASGIRHPGQYVANPFRAALDPASKLPLAREPELLGEGNPKAYGYWESWDAPLQAPFRNMDQPEAAAMLVQEGVRGNGRAVFNHIHWLLQLEDGVYGQIFRNLMSYVYGQPIQAGAVPPIQKRFKTSQHCVIWTKNPYASLFGMEPTAPDELATATRSIRSAVGGQVSALLLLTSGSAEPLEYEVAAAIPGLESSRITLRELQFFKESTGRWIYDPMPEISELTVPPGETRQIWITIDTTGASPGTYNGRLELTGDTAPQSVELDLTIWPFELPADNPLRFCTWDYVPAKNRTTIIGGWDNWTHYQEDLIAHGVNVTTVMSFNHPEPVIDAGGELIEPIDFGLFDSELYAANRGMIYLIGLPFALQESRLLDGDPVAYLSPAWKKAYSTWLTRVVAHLREKGIGYDQFAMYPYDELHKEEDLPKAYEIYKLTKEIDPKIRNFLTLGSRGKEAPVLEKIKPSLAYIDICAPHLNFHFLFSQGPEFRDRLVLAALKEREIEIWSYWNGTERGADNGRSAYHSCRLNPLGAYSLGIEGYGFWAYNVWKGNPWSAFEEDGTPKKNIGTERLSVVYSGPKPVPSIRWEGYREGMNDVKYFEALRREIAAARTRGAPEDLLARADAMIPEGLAEIMDNFHDVDRVYVWRARIAQMIADLRAATEEQP